MDQNNTTAQKTRFDAIVWDWNGTLLNDVNECVDSINEMLLLRNIQGLDYGSYRNVFGFPVRKYYEEAGFDFIKEPYDKVAIEFIDIYRKRLPACGLFPDVIQILNAASTYNIPQFVLSAMEQELLETSLQQKGIKSYFKFVSGTSDHYADGKLGSARRLQEIIGLEPEKILMIGDTIHDHEVAEVMGWQNVLISRGHQSEPRLRATGRPVLQNLIMLETWLNGHSS